MADPNSSNTYYSGSETSPSLSDSSYKRQKTQHGNMGGTSDFLGFDYNNAAFTPLEDPISFDVDSNNGNSIPEDFFAFVESPPTDLPIRIPSLPTTPAIDTAITTNTTTTTPTNINTNTNNANTTDNATITPVTATPAIKRPLPPQPTILFNDPPNEAVHTIVVGGRPFRLSWESLKSDGPSNFFLDFFRKKKQRVMHIDRDPEIFELIVRHLRGYYIRSKDDIQHQSLLFDSHYYGLKRLRKMLQEYLCVNIGGRVFRLPWELFQKDGTHNFFTGPLMHSLLSPDAEDGSSPPIYIDRDPDIFEDIVNHLRGYTIHIRDEMHRKNLLKDAQYYVFRQLSDKLLTAQQTVAGFDDSSNPEVLLLLQDVRVVNMLPCEDATLSIQDMHSTRDWSLTQLKYKRTADGPPHALLVQVADLCMQVHRTPSHTKLTYEMNETDMKKMRNMAHVAKATEGVSMEIYLDEYCAVAIDDQQVPPPLDFSRIETQWEPCNKCEGECTLSRLILQRAICGVHLIDKKITLSALRLEAISSRFRLNLKRQFLSG